MSSVSTTTVTGEFTKVNCHRIRMNIILKHAKWLISHEESRSPKNSRFYKRTLDKDAYQWTIEPTGILPIDRSKSDTKSGYNPNLTNFYLKKVAKRDCTALVKRHNGKVWASYDGQEYITIASACTPYIWLVVINSEGVAYMGRKGEFTPSMLEDILKKYEHYKLLNKLSKLGTVSEDMLATLCL